MTDVAQHLKDLIRADGPISIAEFMRICLTGRGDSYYRRSDPFGAAGDFVTAPEVSQIFGELIGLWCADVWRQLGAPKRFSLVELGPGRGTLMRDALRAARVVPGFLDAVSVVFVEVSEALRRVQRDTLSDTTAPVHWHDAFDDIDAKGPVIVIANEFFDALPVRQFVRTQRGWAERCVGLDANGALMLGMSEIGVGPMETVRDVDISAIAERSPMRVAVARAVGERIAEAGGAALVIDYGFDGAGIGDTLQAVRGHQHVDVLEAPGSADLTSHVDFTRIGWALRDAGARVCPLTTQGAFLNALGAFERVAKLKAGASAAQAEDLDSACHRLTAPEAMGSLFKVLCAVAPDTLQPAGFPPS